MLTDAVDRAAVRRVLVVKLRHHGDVLLTSPVFTALKSAMPDAELDALVYRDTAEMLSLHPALHRLHVVTRSRARQGALHALNEEWALLRELRARRYDLLIHLTENPRGAWLARLLRPRYAVARALPGRRGRLWRASFTHLYKEPPRLRHVVEKHLDALRRLGIYPTESERSLVLTVGDAAQSAADALLEAHGIAAGGFVHLHPASRWLFKTWRSDGYATLIDRLHEEGARVVITGSEDPRERAVIDDILARVARAPVDLSGRLSLKALAGVARRARVFVGVDSAPMHVACAMGTPVVALFGPSGDLEWGPWRVPHRVVSAAYSCRPCGLDGCGGGKRSDCLEAIPVAAVLQAVREVAR